MHPELTVRESLELFAGYYRQPARRRRRRSILVGLAEKADDRVGSPLRWPAAAARRGAGADRRSRTALPRRADDGLRPLGATPGVGDGGEPARARQDRVPDHALHGRGAGAGGPGGDHRRRRDRGPGLAGRAGRPGRRRRPDQLPAPGRGSPAPTSPATLAATVGNGEVRLRADDPVPRCCMSSRPGRWSDGSRWRDWRSGGPSLEDVYLELTADEPRRGGGGMSGMALALHQFRFDQKTFWRNPASVFFTVMFPVMFLVIFDLVFGGDDTINGLRRQTSAPITCRRSSPSPSSRRPFRTWPCR